MNSVFTLVCFPISALLIQSCGSGHPEQTEKKPFPVSVSQAKPAVILRDSSYSSYMMDPDSLFADDNKAPKADDILSQASAYRVFLEKMKEIQKNSWLFKDYGLPAGSKIIEYTELKDYPGRTILLWMIKPKVVIGQDDQYTCPDVTLGKGYFSGITRVSLADTKRHKLVNTIELYSPEDGISNDTIRSSSGMAVPFAIRNPTVTSEIGGLKYHAIGGTISTEGKAQLLFLDDFNGDGKKLEFAFYLQEGCMGCGTTLFGYSPVRDSLLQYDITLKVVGFNEDKDQKLRDTTYMYTSKWIDQAFCFHFNRKGALNFDQDYRGRGGNWDRYHLTYYSDGDYISGILNSRPQAGDDSIPQSWYRMPEQTK